MPLKSINAMLFSSPRLHLIAAVMLLATGVFVVPAHADVTRMEDIPRGQASDDYKRALRLSGVRHEAFYVDQVDGEIPMDKAPRFNKRDEESERSVQLTDFQVKAIAVGVLIGIGILLWKFGGGSQISFRRLGGDKTATGTSEVAAAEAFENVETSDFIRMIGEMPDRRKALILLVGRVLLQAASSNGLRLRRSETAREILRRIPRTWTHFTALKSLVSSGELVHFGGRDMSDAQFAECLEQAKPMLVGAVA